MKSTIGGIIKKLRIEKGLTLTQLGGQVGIDSGALSKIENGKKDLDERTLPQLAIALAVELEYLKNEFFSEKIAIELISNNCSKTVLRLAKNKMGILTKTAK